MEELCRFELTPEGCTRVDCRFRHVRERDFTCKWESSDKGCRKKDCKYQHKKPRTFMEVGQSTENFTETFCKWEDKNKGCRRLGCKFQHKKPRNFAEIPCKYELDGGCAFREKCPYLHTTPMVAFVVVEEPIYENPTYENTYNLDDFTASVDAFDENLRALKFTNLKLTKMRDEMISFIFEKIEQESSYESSEECTIDHNILPMKTTCPVCRIFVGHSNSSTSESECMINHNTLRKNMRCGFCDKLSSSTDDNVDRILFKSPLIQTKSDKRKSPEKTKSAKEKTKSEKRKTPEKTDKRETSEGKYYLFKGVKDWSSDTNEQD